MSTLVTTNIYEQSLAKHKQHTIYLPIRMLGTYETLAVSQLWPII